MERLKRLRVKPTATTETTVESERSSSDVAATDSPSPEIKTPEVSVPATDTQSQPESDTSAPAAPAPESPTATVQSPAENRASTNAKDASQTAPTAISTHRQKRLAATTEHRYHVVASGHTLGKIAKRYLIKVESLCGANGLSEHTSLKVGQKLVIPNGDDDPIISLGPEPSESHDTSDDGNRHNSRSPNAIKELSVPGAGPVYYFEPSGHGRNSMRPLVVYLHGRGGDAEADCRKWSRVARRFGWLVCPSGPTPHNSGRTWNNNWVSGQHAVMGAIQALRNLYGRRVQLYGNTLIGFSEGAYVAMNVGVRQPRTFNRWLILGADTSYWGGAGVEALKDAKSKVRRVVLITGEHDQVVEDTRTVAGWLEKEHVNLRLQTPADLAHEVAIDRKPELYISALHWLDNGGPTGKQAQKTSHTKH
jgi:predicted esterase/LysM repeat protein